MVESSEKSTTIFADHSPAVGIAKQRTLSMSAMEKQNPCLIRASEYLQRFKLNVRHKPCKLHIVPDALSRLASSKKVKAWMMNWMFFTLTTLR